MKFIYIITFHFFKQDTAKPGCWFVRNYGGLKNVIIFILTTFYLIQHQQVMAQNNAVVWADSCSTLSFYGKLEGKGYSDFTQVHKYKNDGMIVTGTVKDTFQQLEIEKNYANVMYINTSGNLLWSKFIGINNPSIQVDLRVYASLVTSNGDIVVLLTINAAALTGNYIVRLNSDGRLVWQKRILNLSSLLTMDSITEIIETTDGGFLIVGHVSTHGVIIKLTGDGNFVWYRAITSGDFNSEITAITEGSEGYYIVGSATGLVNGFTGNYICRLNKNLANIEWIKWIYFPGSPPLMNMTEYEYDKMIFNGGVIALTGNTRVNYTGLNRNAQVAIFMDENAGSLSATRIENLEIETDPANLFHGILYHPFAKTGVQFTNTAGGDYYVFRLKEDGTPKWAWQIVQPQIQGAKDSKVLDDLSFVVAGFKRDANNAISASLLKTSGTGKLDNCINQPFSLIVSNPVVALQNVPNVQESISNNDPITTAALDTMSGTGITWQLQCNGVSNVRMSKIRGNKTVCRESSNLFSVIRDGDFSNAVTFSANAPVGIVNISDSAANISFSSEGTVVLYASWETPCGILKDSMIVQVIKSTTGFSLGSDTFICPNNKIILKVEGDFTSYLWQNSVTDSIYAVTTPGLYQLTVTDVCGFSYNDTIKVDPAPSFDFTIGPNRVKCNADTLHINGPSGFYNYNWSPVYQINSAQNQDVIINPLIDTVYSVIAEKSPGCFVYDTVKIEVRYSPRIQLGSDKNICNSETLLLDAGTGFENHLWSDGKTTPVNLVTQPGTYSVTGYFANGCKSYDTISISNNLCLDDIYIPNVFTPNNDRVNEIFKPFVSLPLSQYNFQIFTRWGQKIFETNDINKGWDGKFKGEGIAANVLVWVCTYQFGGKQKKIKKGTVIIMR